MRDHVRREERSGPTPETAAKRRDDHLSALPAGLQLAAVQIRQARKWLVRRLEVRAGPLERAASGHSELTDEQSVAVERYLAWGRELERRKLPYQVVIGMVGDGVTPTETERFYRLPTGRATDMLLECLDIWSGMWSGRVPVIVSGRGLRLT